LEAIILHIYKQQEPRSTFFILAHSYGVSQILQLLHEKITNHHQPNIKQEKIHNTWIPIQGLILLSAVLKDTADPLTRDGGHFISVIA
jgi:hypothetical protein